MIPVRVVFDTGYGTPNLVIGVGFCVQEHIETRAMGDRTEIAAPVVVWVALLGARDGHIVVGNNMAHNPSQIRFEERLRVVDRLTGVFTSDRIEKGLIGRLEHSFIKNLVHQFGAFPLIGLLGNGFNLSPEVEHQRVQLPNTLHPNAGAVFDVCAHK